ncbi:isocitrate lyase/phosphoenolpyruvate mutase family protein [Acidiferrimicrobium sp. IK]|uniref:isocitrate lyase/PEP mutase family protein n=1 Tax=Acidiferrimicrobium sp. IK TaxID=2871700 RepID=UPI0021CB6CF5|nr:isocitrate lyase/phosphoenolpyruvate mutase family protein [Acidiferrimicrobium sp. IK]MCU4187015.1 isocitrate lyase/phosphoenolpyruvate mutase family protein [Acidiferrimicrobium sp. IK]
MVAGSYQPHTAITAEADRAVDRLVVACGGVRDEHTACRIGLLVQAAGAMPALIEGRNPPVDATRRVTPTGETIELGLNGIAFGAGRHACPGRAQALALASTQLAFHRLHRGDTPLILPNAWDFASGAAFADAGFLAVGTTSLGVAAANGLPDAAGATLTQTLDLASRLVKLDVPITVDLEAGFGQDPSELSAQLWELGVAGVNIEDGRSDHLCEPVEQARFLRAFKDGAPGLFLNARIDTYWLGIMTDSTLERAKRYEQAGADGVFVPGLTDDRAISATANGVDVPLNVLAQPDAGRLAALGVRRISTGSLLYRSALGAAVQVAASLRDGRPLDPQAPSYEAVQTLVEASLDADGLRVPSRRVPDEPRLRSSEPGSSSWVA